MGCWLRYAAALVVAAHGFVYVGPLSPARTHNDWSGAWYLAGSLAGDRLKALAWALHLITAVATLACAGAMAFPSVAPGWWRALALISGVTGLAAFLVVWDGRPASAFAHGGVGALVSVMLLAAAVVFPRAFD